MRPSALLVNTSRGAIVDHAALIDAITGGRLGGYATDVWDPEPPPVDDLARLGDRLLVTPHVAAITDVTYREICVRTVEAAIAALVRLRRFGRCVGWPASATGSPGTCGGPTGSSSGRAPPA